jgi:glycosyltransferase involved in cell wall biosynthesis
LNHIPEKQFTHQDRKNTIVFCGSLVAQKNPLFAIEGFVFFLENFGNDFPDAKLILIGKGELKTKIENEVGVINHQYGKNVIELVTDEKLVEVLSSSKLFLSLQDYDNYPSQSLMEAMVFCNSIISFNNGDTNKLVKEELGNVLLEDKSPDMLGLAIKNILKDWQLNIKNRKHIQEHFSPKVFSNYFFSVHNQLIN